MKLTRASSYALQALVHIAEQKDTSEPVASHLVARAQGIPERFLLKVLKPLVSVRVLHSVKGPNGGYRLARKPSDISVLDVVEAVDGPIRGQVSFLQEKNGNAKLDRKLETVCNEVAGVTRKQLEGFTIADLMGAKGKAGRAKARS
jgi:Rrf2 family protein